MTQEFGRDAAHAAPQGTTHGSASGSSHAAAGTLPPPAATLHLWQIQGVRDVLVLFIVFAIIAIGYWLRDVTVPLLIALALAYLFEPLVQRLTRFRGITRTGAVTIILLTVGVGATLAITLTAPVAIGQTVDLINRVRTSDFSALGNKAINALPEQYRDELRPAVELLSQGIAGTVGANRKKEPSNGQKATPTPTPTPRPEGAASPDVGKGSDATSPAGKDSAPPNPPSNSPSKGTEAGNALVPPSKSEVADAQGEASSDAKDLDAATQGEDHDERVRALVRAELEAMGINPLNLTAPPALPAAAGPWRILGALGATAERVGAVLIAIVQYSLILFLIPFYFWFFSVSFPQLLAFGRSVLPRKNRERTLELIGLMDRAVSGFVRGRIVISAIMGILFAIGWLICGVPYAITLGLFVGALSLVPYLGGIGVPLAIGLLVFDQLQMPGELRMAWWGSLVWPTIVFVVVQSIEGYVLTPLIAGKATDLDPVTIVVAIIAGGSVAGVYGMLLAIPLAACGKILITHLVLPSVRAWSRGEAADPLPIEPIPPPVVEVGDPTTEA
jgi:predicted PurR-regulated permease PerM